MSRKILRWAAVPALLWICATAQAVHLSDTGRGGALILPYWTGAGGNDTLITIRNHEARAAAVKVRMMDVAGAEVRAFNLYLNGEATWTGAVSDASGIVSLISFDESCALPAYSGNAVALAAESGYIEIVEMGRAGIGATLDGVGEWIGCDDLVDRFDSGAWQDDPNLDISFPVGAISASASLIHVEVGTMVAINATALAGFSDIPQHTRPESDVPNLSTPHDSDAGSGKTRSRICTETECRIDAWALPVEAVAAVLMAKAIEADVVINAAIGALTELVIVKPLERYWSVFSESKLYLRRRDATPVAGNERPGPCPAVGNCSPQRSSPWFPVDSQSAVAVVSLSATPAEIGLEQVSPLLSAPIFPSFSLEGQEFVSGIASVFFEQWQYPAGVSPGICNDEVCMAGEPVIGFVIQQLTNGTLIDADGSRIRANYRTAVEWTRELDLREIP